MRSKIIAAIVVVLSASTMVLAQTKISVTAQCPKGGEEHAFEIGDRPNHTFLIVTWDNSKGDPCTWSPKPLEIAGMQGKGNRGASSVEISGTKYRVHGYRVTIWADGDKSYESYQGSGILKDGVPEGQGTWNATGGTGKLKGLKGKGTYKEKGAADGSSTMEFEGEYELPK